jgi:thioredoxin 1
MTDGMIDLSAEDFERTVASGTWLVDFWATWCGPCHALEPVLREFAEQSEDVGIARVEIGSQPQLAEKFGIRSVPTLIVFAGGEPVKTMFGAKTLRQITRALEEVTGN